LEIEGKSYKPHVTQGCGNNEKKWLGVDGVRFGRFSVRSIEVKREDQGRFAFKWAMGCDELYASWLLGIRRPLDIFFAGQAIEGNCASTCHDAKGQAISYEMEIENGRVGFNALDEMAGHTIRYLTVAIQNLTIGFLHLGP
jgi:hypothetical protein